MKSRTATPILSPTSSGGRSISSKPGGCFGLIATNTIGQGDTRSTGLRWICTHGGTIYNAPQAIQMARPGRGCRERRPRRSGGKRSRGPFLLDRPRGSAHHRVSLPCRRPRRSLPGSRPMKARASSDSYVLGMGFTFDDTDTKGVASPIAEMHEPDREGPAQRRTDLPLHRWRGGQRFADSCSSSLCHQLRRDERRGGTALAGFDANRGGRKSSRSGLAGESDAIRTADIGGDSAETTPANCSKPSVASSGCW